MANPYLPIVTLAAQKYNVRAPLLASLLQHESNFNPTARSPAGALGIAQFMPGTAKGLGINPMNPRQAIFGAANYLHGLENQFHGNERLALAAYNAGAGAVQKYGGIPPYAETQAYVRNVYSGASQYPGLAASSAGAVATPGSPSPRAGAAPAPAAPVPHVVDNSFLQGIINSNADIAGVPTITLPKVTAIGQLSPPSPTHPNGVQIAVDHNQPLSPLAGGVIQAARKFLGTPYVWGGAKPGGFDCSGLIQYVYGLKGVALPRTSQQQFKVGRPVAQNALRPGDILFFSGSDGTKAAPGHEALYIGHGQFIQAPHTGDVVRVSSLSDPYYQRTWSGARRVT